MSKGLIFIFEDTDEVLGCLKDTFERLNLDTCYPSRFSSANYFLNEEPGIHAFKLLVVDLNIPFQNTDFDKEQLEEIYEQEKVHKVRLSGWIWVKAIMEKYYCYRNVVVLSAYVNNIPDVEKEKFTEKGVLFIDKTQDSAMSLLEQRLSQI